MKKIVTAFSLCLLVSGLALAQTSRSRTGDTFRGPVRSVRIERAKISRQNDEYVEGARLLVVTKSYAADWSWSEYIGYKPDGTPSQKVITTYTPDGWQASVSTFAGDGKPLRKVTYVYKDGKLAEENTFDGKGALQRKRVLVWESNGRAIAEITYYDGRGSLIKKAVKTRNPETKKSVWTTYNADGSVAEEAVYDRNYEGSHKSEIVKFNADGTLADKYVGESDADARQFEKAVYNPDGTLRSKWTETREYDSHGNLSKLTTKRWDELTGKYEPVAVSYYIITYN